MHRYQMGDASAANELVDQLHPILQRFFWAIAGGSTPIDDLLQECWLRIHRARHSYRQGEPVLPWVFAIARHSRVDQFRRMQRTSGRESSIDGVPELKLLEDPRQQWDGSLTAQRIMQVVEVLPPAQRDVVIMLKIAGMTLEEVAQATGSNANAVKQRAFRAYRTIREELGVEEPKE
jgi:RNA polymerase sigma-70 factor, ECF subfamily